MMNSIRYFEEECMSRLEEMENRFLREPEKLAEYVIGLTDELHNLGLRMIQESLETMDQMIQQSGIRKKYWLVESHTSKQLLTSLGEVRFRKTLFTNKETGQSEYLLDRVLRMEKNQRMTEDAEANLLQEAVQTSYRRGGEETSLTSEVGKQTVKNKIHQLKFPEPNQPEEKRVVDYLYIEADEDHVSLQFREKRGDLVENSRHQKNNHTITKLVYVHEGIEPEAPKSSRHKLICPYYFCSVSQEEDNREFWERVYRYLDSHYELDKVKKIYLNADGGVWIRSGLDQIPGAVYVLDEFHLEQCLTKLTSHMKDSHEDARQELRTAIRKQTKKEFSEIVDRLKACLPDENGYERLDTASGYILSNWGAARLRLKQKEGILGSSTEGHVSHVLSSRMSSRPMGWSILGAGKMARLRAYHMNHGNMLELVRYQKKDLPVVARAEYDVLSADEVMATERNRHGQLGKYMSRIQHPVSEYAKKLIYFNAHIWGL